jgi:CBS domain-containing protein
MARYGGDFEPRRMGMRDFTESRGYGGDYRIGVARWRRGGQEPMNRSGFGRLGGMRSDEYPSRWDRFPGEEGWLGRGYAGYPDDLPEQREWPGSRYWRLGPGAPESARAFGPRPRESFRYDRPYPGRRGREDEWAGRRGGYDDADRVRVRDIMTEDPEFVTPGTSVADVAKKMQEVDVGIIPVVESEETRRLRGVVTDRDLAVRVLAAGKDGKAKVEGYMTEQVRTVNKNAPVREVFEIMKREQVRRVPVTDRDGRLVGIVAQADLAVEYAGLDLQRETEVEEVIERISEPARPRNR